MASWRFVQDVPPQSRLTMEFHESSSENIQEEEIDSDLTFIDVNLQITIGLTTTYRAIKVCLDGVLSEEGTPIFELRDILSEMGIATSLHVFMIASLFEFIQSYALDYSGYVVINYEQVGVHGRVLDINHNESGFVYDDEEIVDQVQQERVNLRVMLPYDEFDAVVSVSMELDLNTNVKTKPANEVSIAGLEKVYGREGGEVYTCVICDDDGDKSFARMPCLHLFHNKCLVTWLRKNGSCPLCRFRLV